MRVVLWNPNAADGRDFSHSLSVGAEYEVLGIENDYLRLLTDNGEPVLFDAGCFDVTDPSEPPFWVSEFAGEGERYVYPPGWGGPGFFEDWFDRVAGARETFAAQFAVWYPVSTRAGRTPRCT